MGMLPVLWTEISRESRIALLSARGSVLHILTTHFQIAIGTLAVAFGGALLPSYLPKSEPTVKAAPTPVAPVASKEDDIDVEKLLDNFLKDNEEKK
jgi:hypothetical protein